jgi:hypothetical protein
MVLILFPAFDPEIRKPLGEFLRGHRALDLADCFTEAIRERKNSHSLRIAD